MKKIVLLTAIFTALIIDVYAQNNINKQVANYKGYSGEYAIPFLYEVHKKITDYIYNGYKLDTDSITDME